MTARTTAVRTLLRVLMESMSIYAKMDGQVNFAKATLMTVKITRVKTDQNVSINLLVIHAIVPLDGQENIAI